MMEKIVHADFFVRLSEMNAKSVMETRGLLIEESSAVTRCLFLSLVLLNAGAALAVFFSAKLPMVGQRDAAILALAGVVCALVQGYCQLLAIRALRRPINRLLEEWAKPKFGVPLDAQALMECEAQLPRALRPWGVLAHVFGWFSLVLFLASTITIAHFYI